MSERYDTSEEALRRPVDADELTELIDSGARGLNATKVVHLLRRTRATLAGASQTIAGLHRHIASLQEHSRRSGAATTLNPVDALRFLDDAQKEQIFGQLARTQLNTLRALVDRAQATADRVNAELATLRAIAKEFSERPDLPPEARGRLAALAGSLPLAASEVYRPPMLDLPDPDATLGPVHEQVQPGAPSRPSVADAPGTDDAPSVKPSGPDVASPALVPAPDGLRPAPESATFVDPYAASQEPAAFVDPYAPQKPATFVDPYAPQGPPTFADPYAPQEPPTFVDPYAPQEPATFVDPYAARTQTEGPRGPLTPDASRS